MTVEMHFLVPSGYIFPIPSTYIDEPDGALCDVAIMEDLTPYPEMITCEECRSEYVRQYNAGVASADAGRADRLEER